MKPSTLTDATAPASSPRPESRPIDLREAYSIYFRRRWLALLIVLGTVLGVAVGDYLHYPVFESNSRVLVERTAGADIPFSQDQIAFRKSEITETQAQLLTSGPVLEEVARRLDLANRPAPQGSPRDLVHAYWNAALERLGELKQSGKKLVIERVLGKRYTRPPPPDPFARAVRDLRSSVRAESIPNTDIVELSVRDLDPQVARAVGDAITAIYLEHDLAQQQTKARHVYDLIDAEIQSFRPRYDAARQAVEQFEAAHQARLLKDKARTLLQQISQMEVAYGELVESQKSRILTLELELARFEKLFSADHPKVIGTRSELAKARENLGEGKDSRPITLSEESKGRADALLNRISDTKRELEALTQLEGEYARLLEVKERNEKLYLDLESKREAAAVAEATRTSGPRIVDPAIAPDRPVSPRHRLNLVLGLIGGLFLAVAICAVLEFLDRSIRTPADVGRVAASVEVWSIPDWRRPGALPRRPA